ncbi:MAG: hypothetical protein ACP6KW_09280 [Candidatus Thorarchaeota archaeon]
MQFDLAGEQTTHAGAMTEKAFKQYIPKYFVHGLLFSALVTLGNVLVATMSLGLVSIVAALAAFTGELVGWVAAAFLLIVVFILILLVLGLVNTILARALWKASPSMNWKTQIGQGFVMLLLLFIFGLPSILLDTFVPISDVTLWIATTVVRVVVYAIIYGYTGRWVAYGFTEIPASPSVQVVPAGLLAECPACGGETLTIPKEGARSKVTACTMCGAPFEVFVPEQNDKK